MDRATDRDYGGLEGHRLPAWAGPRTQGASTIRFRTYPGGFLKLAGSLSASELSQMAIRDLSARELDRFAIETENSESDPVHLMKLRQLTFERTSKLIMECSPTIAGESRVKTPRRTQQASISCSANPSKMVEPEALRGSRGLNC